MNWLVAPKIVDPSQGISKECGIQDCCTHDCFLINCLTKCGAACYNHTCSQVGTPDYVNF